MVTHCDKWKPTANANIAMDGQYQEVAREVMVLVGVQLDDRERRTTA